jgi:hypothetical protein
VETYLFILECEDDSPFSLSLPHFFRLDGRRKEQCQEEVEEEGGRWVLIDISL